MKYPKHINRVGAKLRNLYMQYCDSGYQGRETTLNAILLTCCVIVHSWSRQP